MATLAPLGPPFDEAVYKDFPTIKAALQERARVNGFANLRVRITSSWCYPMSAVADKPAGTTTDFVAYCHTMRLKGFFGPCDGEKILVKEFSSGQLSRTSRLMCI